MTQLQINNPATGEKIAALQADDAASVAAKAVQARAGQPAWAARPLAERMKCIEGFRAGVVRDLESLATSGGVAAGTGGFESHLLGEIDLYASDLAHAVMVDLGERRLIVTPDDPEGFLEALSSP